MSIGLIGGSELPNSTFKEAAKLLAFGLIEQLLLSLGEAFLTDLGSCGAIAASSLAELLCGSAGLRLVSL